MRKPIILLLALFLVVTMVAGCASIIHGSRQKVTFQTTPADATVTVSDGMGVGHGSCVTPCSLDLKRGREYKILIMKDGYEPVEILLEKKSDGWIWGNIFFGGIIGLIVDFSNGSAYKLAPDQINSNLVETAQANSLGDGSDATIVVVDFNKLSGEEKLRLANVQPIMMSGE